MDAIRALLAALRALDEQQAANDLLLSRLAALQAQLTDMKGAPDNAVSPAVHRP